MKDTPIRHGSGDPDDNTESGDKRKSAAQIGAVGRGTPDAETVSYRWEVLPSRGSGHAVVDPISRASQVLLAASETDSDLVERSNAFDLWKSLLEEASENALARSVHFRQVLGLLLVAIRRRDLTDFSAEDLVAFRTVTNILHSASVVEADTGRAARALAAMRPRLPLMQRAEEESDSAADGESLIEQLLSRA